MASDSPAVLERLNSLARFKDNLVQRYQERNDTITKCIQIREQDWPNGFPSDMEKSHPWIQIPKRFYSMVKPVFSDIADESLARIEAAVGLGLPMPQERYYRDFGAPDKPHKEAWLRAMQLLLDRKMGISQYARSVNNILMAGRSARLSYPSIHAVDWYSKELMKMVEGGGLTEDEMAAMARTKPAFINQELDPRTVYCYPNEWEPTQVFIIETRPIWEVATEYGVDITREGVRMLGPGEYPTFHGMRTDMEVETTTFWTEDELMHFVSNNTSTKRYSSGLGLMIENKAVEHGYGEIMERVGNPGKVPVFIAPGMMRGWGDTREAMPILVQIEKVLSAYDSALTMSLAYAMLSIPRNFFRQNKIAREDAEFADVGPSDEDLAGPDVFLYQGEEYDNLNQQLPIETLEKQKDQLRQQIDEFFVGYVMRGTPPGSLSNVSGNVISKMQIAAVAPFLQLSLNLDERDSSIFRFWLGCVESVFEEKVYVWDNEFGRDLALGPDDIKGDYWVQSTSQTGLPDSRIIDEEITSRRVKDGFELPSVLLNMRNHPDLVTYLSRLLKERSVWLQAEKLTQMMVEESLPGHQQPPGAPVIYGPRGLPIQSGTGTAARAGIQPAQAQIVDENKGIPITPRGGPGGIPAQGGAPNAGLEGFPSNAGGAEGLQGIMRELQATMQTASGVQA